MGKLDNKVAIVTGASSGMGAATAIEFAREGAKVVLVARNEEKLKKVLQNLQDKGGEGEIVVADVSKDEDNKRIVETTVSKFGGIHVAFINAGLGIFEPLLEAKEETIDTTINVNFKGVVFGLKHLLPAMSKCGDKGSVIVNTSIVGERVMVNNVAGAIYSSSKAAANMMVKYGAVQGAPMGVRVNAVAPGVVKTSFASEMPDGDEMMKQLAASAHLRGDLIMPEDVAKLVTFLASDDAHVMTGAIHNVDDGGSLKL